MNRVYPQLLWDKLWSSYWFVPSVMALGAAALAVLTTALDEYWSPGRWRVVGWLEIGGPEAARITLGTIAGSMITIAGVTFSIIIVALSLASQQFGPRLLYAFMGDRGNQVVLGAFIATFLYCLIVLREVKTDAHGDIVPHLSVTVSLLLSMWSLGVLIYFLHHAAATIQAEYVVSAVAADLRQTILAWTPDEDGAQPPLALHEHTMPPDAAALVIHDAGYVQGIDYAAVVQLAAEADVRIHLDRRPGHFVLPDQRIGWVSPGGRLSAELRRGIIASIVTGRRRTHTQDIEFGVDQLVEVAVRSLSPGINDPFTAMMCIDRLSECICVLVRRGAQPSRFTDAEGVVRLTAVASTQRGIIATGFNQVRQLSVGYVSVTIRLLEAIAAIAEFVRTQEQRDELLRQAEMVENAARGASIGPHDLDDILRRAAAAATALRPPRT